MENSNQGIPASELLEKVNHRLRSERLPTHELLSLQRRRDALLREINQEASPVSQPVEGLTLSQQRVVDGKVGDDREIWIKVYLCEAAGDKAARATWLTTGSKREADLARRRAWDAKLKELSDAAKGE